MYPPLSLEFLNMYHDGVILSDTFLRGLSHILTLCQMVNNRWRGDGGRCHLTLICSHVDLLPHGHSQFPLTLQLLAQVAHVVRRLVDAPLDLPLHLLSLSLVDVHVDLAGARDEEGWALLMCVYVGGDIWHSGGEEAACL